jgi:hypothetical protein
VFVTSTHTIGANKLWDKLTNGNITSIYVGDFRLLGPKDRFKITKRT